MRGQRIRNNRIVRICGKGIKHLEPSDSTPYTNLEKLKNELKNIVIEPERKKLSFINL